MVAKHKGAQRVGKMTFSTGKVKLGREMLPCRIYTWEAPGLIRGSVKFIGPDGCDPFERRFLPEALAKSLAVQNPRMKPDKKAKVAAEQSLAEFFDVAFDAGYRVLKDFDPDTPIVPPDLFAVMKALFHSRGYLSNRRRLDSGSELVRRGDDYNLEVVVPGLSSATGEVSEDSERSFNKQERNARVRSALSAAGWSSEANGRVAPAARAFLTQKAEQNVITHKLERTPRLIDATQLRWGSHFDALTTCGVARLVPWDYAAVEKVVCNGLLAGSDSIEEDIAKCKDDPRFFDRLLKRLLLAVSTKDPSAFGKWFVAEREHGFMWLLGHECDDVPPDIARAALRAAYRVLTWLSVVYLAKCYGAWAFRVWIDFQLHNTEGPPSPGESWLFQQQNFRQLALAGLPFAFLSPGQMLWVWRPLTRAWAQGAAAWDEYERQADIVDAAVPARESVPSEPVIVPGLDGVSDEVALALLQAFAESAATVRKVDRETQAEARRKQSEKEQEAKRPPRRRDVSVEEVSEAEALRIRYRPPAPQKEVRFVAFDRNIHLHAPRLLSAYCERCKIDFSPCARSMGPQGERYAELECKCGRVWYALSADFGE